MATDSDQRRMPDSTSESTDTAEFDGGSPGASRPGCTVTQSCSFMLASPLVPLAHDAINVGSRPPAGQRP